MRTIRVLPIALGLVAALILSSCSNPPVNEAIAAPQTTPRRALPTPTFVPVVPTITPTPAIGLMHGRAVDPPPSPQIVQQSIGRAQPSAVPQPTQAPAAPAAEPTAAPAPPSATAAPPAPPAPPQKAAVSVPPPSDDQDDDRADQGEREAKAEQERRDQAERKAKEDKERAEAERKAEQDDDGADDRDDDRDDDTGKGKGKGKGKD